MNAGSRGVSQEDPKAPRKASWHGATQTPHSRRRVTWKRKRARSAATKPETRRLAAQSPKRAGRRGVREERWNSRWRIDRGGAQVWLDRFLGMLVQLAPKPGGPIPHTGRDTGGAGTCLGLAIADRAGQPACRSRAG